MRVDVRERFLEALDSFIPDVILSEYRLARFDGLSALALALERVPETPFIILTNSKGEEAAVECMKAGAWDYVVKERIERLGSVLRGVLEQSCLHSRRRHPREVLSALHPPLLFDHSPEGRDLKLESAIDITSFKQAEAALRDSEHRLSQIIDMLPDATLVIDKEGKVIAWNRAMAAITGVPPKEMIGKGDLEYAIPFYGERRPILIDLALMRRPELEEKYTGLYWMGDTLVGEAFVSNLPRGKAHLSGTAAVLRDSGGEVVAAIECIRDNTERRQAEDALRESEERYRDLVEHSQALIFTHDLHGCVLSVNAWAVKTLGYSEDELLEMNIRDMLTPHTRGKFDGYIEELLHNGSAHGSLAVQTASGERRVWEFHNTLRKEGVATPIVRGMAHDITERRRLEKALRGASEDWRSTFDAMIDPVALLSPDGEIRKCNRAFAAFLGREPASVTGARCFELIHESAEPIPDCPLVRARRTGRREEMDLAIDGKTLHIVVDPILSSNGLLTGFVHIIRDVTGVKCAEEERLRLQHKLQQARKAESLGRMAGAIAHHFNNQLGAVMGNLELALIRLRHREQSEGNVAEALKASHKAAEVSKLMLTCLGQTPGERMPLDLSEFCRRNLPWLRETMRENITFKSDLPVSGPIVVADAAQLEQVLTNLIINAREAVGDGPGTIRLAVKGVLPGDIPESNRFPFDWEPRAEAYACLEVADSGCGIVTKDMEELFDPFFTTKFTGRGLGLPVVLGITLAHKGAVTVESKPGRGSSFRVFLPIQTGGASRQAAPKGPTGGRGTVLLVEDEEMMRGLAGFMLEHLGFTVLSAGDGFEAVELFRKHRDTIRCVLCDLSMPGMNGRETLEVLRRIAPGIPVILASGYTESHALSVGHPEQPWAFLQKPYRVAELKAALDALLNP